MKCSQSSRGSRIQDPSFKVQGPECKLYIPHPLCCRVKSEEQTRQADSKLKTRSQVHDFNFSDDASVISPS